MGTVGSAQVVLLFLRLCERLFLLWFLFAEELSFRLLILSPLKRLVEGAPPEAGLFP